MKFIRHRVNTIAELKTLPREWGAEVDLRSRGTDIILNHDPFGEGDRLGDFVAVWSQAGFRGPLILNPKEDGLESAVRQLMEAHRLDDYFLLDVSLPTAVRLAFREGFRKVAVRVSEFESVECALRFAGRAEWAWIDCFSGEPPAADTLDTLRGRFKVCLVSPELHPYPPSRIASFRPLLDRVDAVCTKHPHQWL